MKNYFVKTQTATNSHMLHCSFALKKGGFQEFVSEDESAARKIFEMEVEALRKEYKTVEGLEYSPSDYDLSHAIYCSLFAIDSEEPEDIEFIEESDYFYE